MKEEKVTKLILYNCTDFDTRSINSKLMNLKNINDEAQAALLKTIKQNVTRQITPGENYIPVTGKVLDESDILLGVDAMLDGLIASMIGPTI